MSTVIDAVSQQKVHSWADVHVRNTLAIIDTDYAQLVQKPGSNVQAVSTRRGTAERTPIKQQAVTS